MWPRDLNTIELRGGLTSTELWMLKERFDAGNLKRLEYPEKAFGDSGNYYTMYGDNANGIFTFCTQGNPDAGEAWCIITAVNKLTTEAASRLLSGWPYE